MVERSLLINPKFVPVALVIAAFGPYLVPSLGLRPEHFVVYGLLPFAVGILVAGRKSQFHCPAHFFVVFVMASIAVWMSAVTLLGMDASLDLRGALGQFENYFQTIALLVVLGAFVRPDSALETTAVLERMCRVLIGLLLLNGVLIFVSVFVDITGYLTPFTGPAMQRVVEGSASMGRFSGIFDTPSTSGAFYSFGLFAWAYLARRSRHVRLRDYAILAPLVGAGLLAVSKTFVVDGIPFFLAYILLPGSGARVANWRFLLVSGLAVGAGVLVIQSWIGLKIFLKIFGSADSPSLLLRLVNVRYGVNSETGVSGLLADLWHTVPVHGVGFGRFTILDSTYTALFVQGGAFALGLYMLVLATLARVGLGDWRRGNEEGRLLTLIAFFTVVGGIGVPFLNMARFNTVFWAFVVLLLAIVWARRREAAGAKILPPPEADAKTRPGAPSRLPGRGAAS